MKQVNIKLTKEQMDRICELRNGEHGSFGIFGQAFIHRQFTEDVYGTADFYYINEEQVKIVSRAITRAKKLPTAPKKKVV